MRKILTGFTILLLAANTGCNLGNKFEIEEKQQIENYLASVKDTLYTKTPSGLYYFTIFEGNGRKPVKGDTVYIWYKVKYLSGNFFDSNIGQTKPYGFIVGSGAVIKGIDEGVQLMKNNGKAKFITPSALAYGSSGLYGYNAYGYYYVILPGFTPLTWEVELDTVIAGSN